MGGGSWTSGDYKSYCCTTSCSATIDSETGRITRDTTGLSTAEIFKARQLHRDLDICGKIRECRDSEEHPNTVPVILGIDVTGSMGNAANRCAEQLNPIMEDLRGSVADVEFSIMGIGDASYDDAPIQMSQFESDVRIAEHLDKIYFEGGGGGNDWESYSLAWWAGLRHCDLDCWNRGKKGIIITMGDEPLNPYLSAEHLKGFLDDTIQEKRYDTIKLYEEASQKFDIYHIMITDSRSASYLASPAVISETRNSWCPPMPDDHFIEATVGQLPQIIANIVKASASQDFVITPAATPTEATPFNSDEVITW